MTSHDNSQKQLTELLDNAPMRRIHYRIWLLSAGGTILDGFTIFTIGIALPLIITQFQIDPFFTGMIASAIVLGAVVGSYSGGVLADRIGRRKVFVYDMMLITFAVAAVSVSPDPYLLLLFQFFVGIGIGMDFPTASAYVSEFMPAVKRSRMLAATIAFQAVGMVLASIIGFTILERIDSVEAWRYMVAVTFIPALIILVLRSFLPESARWLMMKGRNIEAGEVISKILPEKAGEIMKLAESAGSTDDKINESRSGYEILFSKPYLKRTVLTAGGWFFMDIATYGIGLFTPVILTALAFSEAGEGLISRDILSAEGAGIIDIFLLAGFLLGIWLIPRFGPVKMQAFGFAGMVIGMLVLVLHEVIGGTSNIIVFAGFILFNITMNMGPNSTTFMLPAELYPTKLRATGGGFAASFAKIGASIGIFFLPGVKAALGITTILLIMAGCALVGFLITIIFGIRTKGKSLEEASDYHTPVN